MRAFVFPGQGVQSPGMASAVGSTSGIFDQASDAVGVDLLELCTTGRSGEADLSDTRWAQPAIVAVGVASALQALSAGQSAWAVAGHSLGEYTALIVAQSLSVADGFKLVDARARAMQEAGLAAPGTMAAVGLLDVESVTEIAEANAVSVAADNSPNQVVVSGPVEAVATTIELLRKAGAKVTPLEVSGAFHSRCMASAAPKLTQALQEVNLRVPEISFFSSVTATQLTDPSEIGSALVQQLTKPVLWRQTVRAMVAAGATSFLDAGPGRVISNLVKRNAVGFSIETLTEVSRGDRVGHRTV